MPPSEALSFEAWVSDFDAVKAMLVSNYGIDASRADAIGYGEEKPLASNDTVEGQAQNRRVIGKVSADVETKALK